MRLLRWYCRRVKLNLEVEAESGTLSITMIFSSDWVSESFLNNSSSIGFFYNNTNIDNDMHLLLKNQVSIRVLNYVVFCVNW